MTKSSVLKWLEMLGWALLAAGAPVIQDILKDDTITLLELRHLGAHLLTSGVVVILALKRQMPRDEWTEEKRAAKKEGE